MKARRVFVGNGLIGIASFAFFIDSGVAASSPFLRCQAALAKCRCAFTGRFQPFLGPTDRIRRVLGTVGSTIWSDKLTQMRA